MAKFSTAADAFFRSAGMLKLRGRASKSVCLLSALAALLVLVACTRSQSATLHGVWILSSLSGKPVVPGTEVTLILRDGDFDGSGGCNQYGGKYSMTGSDLAFEQILSSAKGCTEPAGVMQQEEDYYNTLRGVSHYGVQDSHLTMSNSNGETVLTFSGK
jgi:heat shock protein HslJ